MKRAELIRYLWPFESVLCCQPCGKKSDFCSRAEEPSPPGGLGAAEVCAHGIQSCTRAWSKAPFPGALPPRSLPPPVPGAGARTLGSSSFTRPGPPSVDPNPCLQGALCILPINHTLQATRSQGRSAVLGVGVTAWKAPCSPRLVLSGDGACSLGSGCWDTHGGH